MAAGSRGGWSGGAWCLGVQGGHGGAVEQGGRVMGAGYFEYKSIIPVY